MTRAFVKLFRWFCSRGIMPWFVVTALLPFYGWLFPWSEASEALTREGKDGIRLLIGAASEHERAADHWRQERQRSFIIIPESLRRFEVYTVRELRGSDIAGSQWEVTRSHWLIPLIALWILAAAFSARIIMPWAKKPTKVPPTLEAVTPITSRQKNECSSA